MKRKLKNQQKNYRNNNDKRFCQQENKIVDPEDKSPQATLMSCPREVRTVQLLI